MNCTTRTLLLHIYQLHAQPSPALRPFICGMVLVLTLPTLACAADSSSQSHSNGLLFSSGFESPVWYEQWGRTDPPRNCTALASDPERRFEPLDGKALRVHVKEGGHYGTSLQFNFQDQLGFEPEAVYIDNVAIGTQPIGR